ncbi:MAG: pyridoxamine 5'-phosphate oxidase [Propionibacteriales bacterium]|nr:pyridoxamine 5'-phosphate oxidase [Propionibacteriales bacterium]
MRAEYAAVGLDEVAAGDDPVALFRKWLAEVVAAEVIEPNAMALATADADGAPSVRTVLLKGLDAEGVVFFTNYDSRKGFELAANPRAAAVMLWHPLQRQVRVEGAVTKLSPEESDAYFASRPHGSQLGAAASPQSQPVVDRAELEERYAQVAAKFGTAAVPRPPYWGGYRIGFDVVEFWQGRVNRMHDRIRFRRVEDGWERGRLAP